MNSTLEGKIAGTQGLIAALQVVAAAPAAAGALIIASGNIKGVIVFSRGCLRGASLMQLRGQGHEGQAALDRALNLNDAFVSYVTFDEGVLTSKQRINIPIAGLLEAQLHEPPPQLVIGSLPPGQLPRQNEQPRQAAAATHNLAPMPTRASEPSPAMASLPQQEAGNPEPDLVFSIQPEGCFDEIPSSVAQEPDQPGEQRKVLRDKEPVGFVGHVLEYASHLAGPAGRRRRRKELPVSEWLGTTTLILLGIGIFTIPSMIKSTNSGSKVTEQQAITELRHEETAADTPAPANTEASQAGSNSGQAGGTANAGDGQAGAPAPNDSLGFARSLVAEGKVASAAPYFENYIGSNPDAIGARIELIQVYLATKQRRQARLLCELTLKHGLTDEELSQVWTLMRQCLID